MVRKVLIARLHLLETLRKMNALMKKAPVFQEQP